MANYILIHGAWHGSWCWYKLKPLLEGLGHAVITPNLPDIKKNDVTLEDYINYIENIISGVDNPIIVGHSMAGIILSSLSNSKIKSLIYLAAFFLNDNQSIEEIAFKFPATNLKLKFSGNYCIPEEEFIGNLFYNECNSEDITLAKTKITHQNYDVLTTKINNAQNNIDKFYIKCTLDNAIKLEAQEYMIGKNIFKNIFEMDSDHSPFLSKALELATILNNISRI